MEDFTAVAQHPDWGAVERTLTGPLAAQLAPAERERLTAALAAHKQSEMQRRLSTVQADAIRPPDAAGEARIAERQRQQAGTTELLPKMLQQIGHAISVGIIPEAELSEDNPQRQMFESVTKPVILIGSMITQGKWIFGGLNMLSKTPNVARALEHIPMRLQAMGIGAATAGGVDAMRADGIPENTSNWDPAAKFANEMTKYGMPERIALGLAGAATGAVLGAAVAGVASGLRSSRAGWMAARMTADEQASIIRNIQKAGIDIGDHATKFQVAKTWIRDGRKVSLNEKMAGLYGDRLGREEYIAEEFMTARADYAQAGARAPQYKAFVAGMSPEVQAARRRAFDIIDANSETVDIANDMKMTVDRFAANGDVPMINSLVSTPGLKPPIPRELTVEEGRLLAGIFRNNPGGVSVVSGVHSTEGVDYAAKALGIKLSFQRIRRGIVEVDGVDRPIYDLLVGRPNYQYPSYTEVGSREVKRVADAMRRASAERVGQITAPKTVEGFVLFDGNVIRGGLNMEGLYQKLKIARPVVEGQGRPDLALKRLGNYVRTEVDEAGTGLTIELPTKLTDRQFQALGRMVDVMKFQQVRVVAADGVEQVLATPFGAQVQDAIVGMVRPLKVTNGLNNELLKQFKATGTFRGQAAVLADGVPAEVVSQQGALRGQGLRYKVRELMTGQVHVVSQKQVTLLPTTIVSENLPTNLFTQHLTEAERAGIVRLRTALVAGWGDAPKSMKQLEQLATSRGYLVTSKRGGKLTLAKVNNGGAEPIPFQNLKSAAEFIRRDMSPMPDITPEDAVRALGGRMPGFIGGSAQPPQFGEMMPVQWEQFESSIEAIRTARSPGYFELRLKSMRTFFRDLDERIPGLQSSVVFENVQSQLVGRQNFEAHWLHGKGGALPPGIKTFDQINKMAGKNANRELITDWLETPKNSPELRGLEAQMTPNELRAAKELRNWYDAIYTHEGLGVNAEWMENYAPRLRELAPTYGNDGKKMLSVLETEFGRIPKGMDWTADHIRSGALDVYDRDAFRVAIRYLRSGSHNRFMKAPLDEAREMVLKVEKVNPSIAEPLGHFTLAVRGYEFMEQRASLTASISAMLDALPGSAPAGLKGTTAETLTDIATGLVYTSVQGARVSLALRNASAVFTMVYPLYGTDKGRFMVSMAKAMTKAGRDEAAAAGAISFSQKGLFGQEEVLQTLTGKAQEIFGRSMTLYNTADDFTRASAFHVGRDTAEDALRAFAKTVEKSSTPAAMKSATRRLIEDSKMFLQDKARIDHFLRLAGTSPQKAAEFAGKQASDVTNFLYGRGMQSRMLRSVSGRWFGQFGTWSMWYADYIGRLMRNVRGGEYRSAATKMLARHAVVNAAVVYAGVQVGIDLAKWSTYGSLFYSGSPGFSLVKGASTLQRGLGDLTGFSDNPLAEAKVKQGVGEIWHTMPTFVPFYFAGRDVLRVLGAEDFTQFGAAMLGTRERRSHAESRRLHLLLGDPEQESPFSSSSSEVEQTLNALDRGEPTIDVRDLRARMVPGAESSPVGTPVGQSPPQSQGQRQSSSQSMSLRGAPSGVGVPSIQYQNPNESNPSEEPEPIL